MTASLNFRHRGYTIYHDPKPIHRGSDWSYVHDDYDGQGDPRCGATHSLETCRRQIDWIEGEQTIDAAAILTALAAAGALLLMGAVFFLILVATGVPL